jgi:hypothetical protein
MKGFMRLPSGLVGEIDGFLIHSQYSNMKAIQVVRGMTRGTGEQETAVERLAFLA